MRCLDGGRSCEYVLRLIWEDESSRRGIKHGRGKHSEISFVDPTPSKGLIEKAKWKAPRNRKRQFLNTVREDVDGALVQSVALVNGMHKRGPALRLRCPPQILDLSMTDGMLFQYCE